MQTIEATDEEIKSSIKITTEPLSVEYLDEQFKPLLTDKAFHAFTTNKSDNTVFEYLVASNGVRIFLQDFNPFSKIGRNINDILLQVDPGIKRHSSLCQYGTIAGKIKFKDKEKLDDSVVLKELADIYNHLIELDFILPHTLGKAPFKLPLALYDEVKQWFVVKRTDGKYIPMPNVSLYASKHKLSDTENEEERLKIKALIDDFEREYTEEEVGELTYKMLYCLFIFPTEKFTEIAVKDNEYKYPLYSDFNRILGKEFFVQEGALAKWEIEL